MVPTAAAADTFTVHDSVVSENPADFIPEVLDGQVNAIAPVGDKVYVGGSFTSVREPGGATLNLPYIFAFDRSTGAIDMTFDPVLDDEVLTLVESPADGTVFAGGKFKTVNGEINRKGLTKLDSNGDRLAGFIGRADGRVKDLKVLGNTLYAGGSFTEINGQPRERLAALDATTGALLPAIDFVFTEAFSTANQTGFVSVDRLDVTPDGSKMVVIGNWAKIDGIERNRLAVIDLTTAPATVADWQTDVYDVQCAARRFPQYILDMEISPDGSYFVTVSTGAYTGGNPACDTAVRWDINAVGTGIEPTWVSYSGGDSLYSVAISGEAIYVGGHQRWMNNPFRGDRVGPGTVDRRGLAALDPLNGVPLSWRSDRAPRGLGAFDLVVSDEGLWVGDDTEFLNGDYHPRLKLLPLLGGGPIPRPTPTTLPTTLYQPVAGELTASSFDGTTAGTSSIADASIEADWAAVRGAVELSGALYTGHVDGTLRLRGFDGTTIADAAPINLNGVTSQYFAVAGLSGLAFDDVNGRFYYTVSGSNALYYRYFSPESQIVEPRQFVASTTVVAWNQVEGMELVGSQLYYSLADGTLHKVDMIDGAPVVGTDLVIGGPAVDGRDWSGQDFWFRAPDANLMPAAPVAEFEFESAGSATSDSWQTFEFEATAGVEVNVKLEWDDPAAAVNLFVRDGNTVLVKDSLAAGTPKWLTVTPTVTGTHNVAVKIKAGATDYRVLVNPFNESPPAP